jgi:hypothetical protein
MLLSRGFGWPALFVFFNGSAKWALCDLGGQKNGLTETGADKHNTANAIRFRGVNGDFCLPLAVCFCPSPFPEEQFSNPFADCGSRSAGQTFIATAMNLEMNFIWASLSK